MRRHLWILAAVAPLLLAAVPLRMLERAATGTVTTANMGLVLPSPGVDTNWASLLNAALQAIDSHDHSSGKGVQVTQAGINITGDLSLNSSNLTTAKSVALVAQRNPPLSFSVPTLYAYQTGIGLSTRTELYYADGLGNETQVTQNGALYLPNVAGFGGNYGTDINFPSANYTTATTDYTFTSDGSTLTGVSVGRLKAATVTKSSNYTVLDGDGFTTVLVNASGGVVTITLPLAVNNSGRLLTVKDTGSAGTNNVTVARQSTNTIDGATSKVINTNYGVVRLTSNGTAWYTL